MPLFICLFFYMGNLECQDISSQQFSTKNFTWDFLAQATFSKVSSNPHVIWAEAVSTYYHFAKHCKKGGHFLCFYLTLPDLFYIAKVEIKLEEKSN